MDQHKANEKKTNILCKPEFIQISLLIQQKKIIHGYFLVQNTTISPFRVKKKKKINYILSHILIPNCEVPSNSQLNKTFRTHRRLDVTMTVLHDY